jgi:hypothetical protein
MTSASMNGNGTAVTRAELKEELARFKTELKTELKTDLEQLKTEIHGDIASAMNYIADRMQVMRDDLSYQIANAARVAAEEHRREIGVVDEKYRDLPARVGLLERELDEHRRDPQAHGTRPRAPKRRPRS